MKHTIYSLIFFFSLVIQAQAEMLTVGVSVPLTGDLAEYGTAVRNGFEMAVQENPAQFKNINFVYEDNQYSGVKGISALRKLKDIDHAKLVYQWGETVLHATAAIAEREHFPLIAMSVDATPAIGKKYTIRSVNPASEYAALLLDNLRKKNIKKISLVTVEDPYLDSLIKGLNDSIHTDEKVEILGSFHPEDNDFKTVIVKLKNHTNDILGVYLLPGQVSTFFRQLHTLDIKIPTFGTDIFESETEIKNSAGGMEKSIYVNADTPNDFITRYVKQFSNGSQVTFAFNAYSIGLHLSEKFSSINNNDLTGEEIIQLLRSSSKYFTYQESSSNGNFYKFPLVIKKIERGVIKVNSDNPNYAQHSSDNREG